MRRFIVTLTLVQILAVAACDRPAEPTPFSGLIAISPPKRPVYIAPGKIGLVSVSITADGDETHMRRMAGWAKRAGVTMVREQINWNGIQNPHGAWTGDTGSYRLLFKILKDSSITPWVTLVLTDSMGCITTNCKQSPANYAPENLQVWTNFVNSIVTMYPEVTYWGIYNEPVVSGWFLVDPSGPYTSRLQAYEQVVHAAAGAIHGRSPARYVVAFEDGSNWPSFLGSLLSADVTDIDVVSVHDYTYSFSLPHDVGVVDSVGRSVRSGGWPIWLTETADIGDQGYMYPSQQSAWMVGLGDQVAATSLSNWQRTFVQKLQRKDQRVGKYTPYDDWYELIDNGSTTQDTTAAYNCFAALNTNATIPSSCIAESECQSKAVGNATTDSLVLNCVRIDFTGPTLVRPNSTCNWYAAVNGRNPHSYTWRVNGLITSVAA